MTELLRGELALLEESIMALLNSENLSDAMLAPISSFVAFHKPLSNVDFSALAASSGAKLAGIVSVAQYFALAHQCLDNGELGKALRLYSQAVFEAGEWSGKRSERKDVAIRNAGKHHDMENRPEKADAFKFYVEKIRDIVPEVSIEEAARRIRAFQPLGRSTARGYVKEWRESEVREKQRIAARYEAEKHHPEILAQMPDLYLPK